MRRNRVLAALAVSVIAAAGLTACTQEKGGGDSGGAGTPGAAEILKRSRESGARLTSARTVFRIKNTDGIASGTISAERAGNCTGTMSVLGRGGAEIVRTGGKVWVKPDAEFLPVMVPQPDPALRGKWLALGDTGSKFGSVFGNFCDLGLQVQHDAGPESIGTPDGRSTPKKVGGTDAVVVTITDEDGATTEATVATEGEPHLLGLEQGTDRSMQFSEFDQPVRATPPPVDQVFDLTTLLR